MNTQMADLSQAEDTRLMVLELVISSGVKAFCAVGDALTEIRDAKLYRTTHGTFEAYCSARWQISRPRVYQLINHSQVVDALEIAAGDLSTNVDISEFAARQIKPHLAEVTEEIRTKIAGGADPVKTTYQVIEAKREEIKADAKPAKATTPDDNPYPDYVEPEPDWATDLEEVMEENRRLEDIIKTLTSNDLAKQALDWQTRFYQLDGRLSGEITTSNEAQKQAQYYSDVLKKIRQSLNVLKNQEIIPRIQKLIAEARA